MMNLNWMTEPLTAYAAIMAGGVAAVHLFVSVKADLRRHELRRAREAADLRRSMDDIDARLSAVAAEAERENRWRAAAAAPLPSGVNQQKRSEALRLCRGGASPDVIAARVGLSLADVLLLRKLHGILADQRPGHASAQERSRILEYSLEA